MMLVELVQVKETRGSYRLNKIWINPKHIVYISEDTRIKHSLREGADLGLVPETTFSSIRLNEGGFQTIISVVGDPEMIESKIFTKQKKNILRG